MRTKLLLSALFSFFFYLLSSQIPQGFNYQAIARDGSGNPIVGATIKVKLSILTDTLGFRAGGGTYIWEEEHLNVLTNAYGLFNIVLGDPDADWVQGVASFDLINWNQPKLYIGTKIANPSTYKPLGGAKLWSVPYSLVAGELGGTVDKIKVKGTEVEPDSALFEVRNKDGQIVFAVYNEGVRVYVADGVKGNTKGGFAIGGFGTDKGTSQNYLMVSRDSIRAYVNDTISKGVTKGGFAIGGFGTAKGKQEYFRVTRDSTRVYVNDLPGKGITKGGFAIGGFGTSKGNKEYLRVTNDSTRIFTGDSLTGFGVGSLATGIPANYLKLTPANYFIGHDAGKVNSTGKFNSFIGYQSGIKNSTGSSNTFMGYQSGYNIKTGFGNLYIGYQSGFASTSGNGSQFIGYQSGYSNTTGTVNTFVGTYSGLMNTKGSYNTYVGNNCGGMDSLGKYNSYFGYETGSMGQGSHNTYIGAKSGNENITGTYNSYLGIYSGGKSTGANNVFLGYNSGNTSDASNSVFLGYNSGSSFDRSNSLIIANSNTTPFESNSLIYGEFDNRFLRINGQLDLPYNSGNSVLTMVSGNGNNFYFKPEADLIRIQSNHTGNPTIMSLDKYGQVGVGSSLSVNGSLYAGITSGNVGIGTNSPTFPFHVYKSPATASWLSTFQNGTISVQLAYGGGSGIFMNTNNATSGNYGLDIYNGSIHVLYARNDGYVGIGTSSPLFKLDVMGEAKIAKTTIGSESMEINALGVGNRDAFIDFHSDDTNTDFGFRVHRWPGVNGQGNIYQVGTGSLGIITMNAAPINFYTNNTHRMTITPSGYVGIGTAAPLAYNLYVNGTTWSTGGWGGSDMRWKKDIEPLDNVLQKIVQINGVKFNWRIEEFPEINFDSVTQIGLIAQDVEKVFPQLVKTNSDGYKAVAYDKLSAVLVEAVKEQQIQIESAKLENIQLRSDLQSLRDEMEQIKALLIKGGMK